MLHNQLEEVGKRGTEVEFIRWIAYMFTNKILIKYYFQIFESIAHNRFSIHRPKKSSSGEMSTGHSNYNSIYLKT